MPEWFQGLANVEDPRQQELEGFVDEVGGFLKFVVYDDNFDFLWEDDHGLRDLARETLRFDVSEGVGSLARAVTRIPEENLLAHGLLGRPLKFKLKVLASIVRGWRRIRRELDIREWFKRVCDAIDAILDSLIQAAGGAGGLVKEFKDALSALAKTK